MSSSSLLLFAIALTLSCARPASKDVRVPTRSQPAPALSFSECDAERGFDVVHHSVDLTLAIAPPSLSGSGDLQLRATRDTGVVVLDANHLAIGAVSLAGKPLPFRVKDERLCALLEKPVRKGSSIELHVTWRGATDRDTPHFSPSDVWGGYLTSAWMPTLQDPAQRATLALRVSAPPALRVAASGRRASESAAAGGAALAVHSFVLDVPTPPFLYAFAAGMFHEEDLDAGGVALRALGPEGTDLKPALRATAASLAFLQAHTGSPLPAAEYTQVFVSGDAAQEAAGLSLLGASSVDDLKRDETDDWIFTHELAHEWFGISIPCADFADFWLNEAFATYFVAATKEDRWGRAAYDGEMKNFRARSAKAHAAGKDAPIALSNPDGSLSRPVAESDLQARGVTYFRGALVLDKLRREIGDDAFWNGIRKYTRDRAGKGARTSDLRMAFESSSGRDLESFFATWVYRAAPGISE